MVSPTLDVNRVSPKWCAKIRRCGLIRRSESDYAKRIVSSPKFGKGTTMSEKSIFYRGFVSLDSLMIRFTRKYGVALLRIAMGLVYLWFGALKLAPGLSPAESLIRESYRFLPPDLLHLFIGFVGVFEVAIGLGFIYGRLPRITNILMILQLGGAFSPLVLRPDLVWTRFPYAFTLEGQYIFKDIILISAGLVIAAATVHRLPEDPRRSEARHTSEIPVENLM